MIFDLLSLEGIGSLSVDGALDPMAGTGAVSTGFGAHQDASSCLKDILEI